MKPMRLFVLLFALMAVSVVPAMAQSQAINGTIEGTLKDAQGGVLPGVTVTLTNVDTGAQRVVTTDSNGTFRAPLLSLGDYKVTMELTGFAKHERNAITLGAGQTVTLNDTMKVGASETVTVTSEAPVVDLGKVDVGRNITEAEMRNLPNVSRNPYNFALLEPGVTGSENSEFGVPRFSVNGQPERINYQIDGNTNTQKDRAGLRLMPMSEVMIREVQVVSSGYAPEFGQTTGMVYNAVTPSGTNKTRGDAGFRFRLKKWSAFPAYFAGEKTDANLPDNSLDIFTFTLGGPLVKNKLQYYLGLEYDYNKIQQNLTVDPGVATTVGVVAQPTNTGSYRKVTQPIGKLDWTINSAHRASFRINGFTNNNPFNASGGGVNTIERAIDFKDSMYSMATQIISTLGTGQLNELRLQYAKRHQTRFAHDPSVVSPTVNINQGVVAATGINNSINFGAPNGQAGQDFTQGITQLVDNFTLLRGEHSFKAGFDAQRISDYRAVPLVYTYTFPTVQAYLDAKSGKTPRGYTTFAQTLGDPNLSFTNYLFSGFVQDDYKVSSTLKLLYGIRYDLYKYSDGVSGAPYNSTFNIDKNNFGPRGGFAWTIGKDQKSVLRGSTGIMYDQPLLAIVETAYGASGVTNKTTAVSLNPTSPGAPAFPATLTGIPSNVVQVSATLSATAPDYQTARTWQNTLTFDRDLGRNFSGSVGLRYTRGYSLPVITDVNLAGITPVSYLADGRGVYSATVSAATRNDPRYNRVQMVQSIGESWYKAVTLQLSKRMDHGIQFNLNYSYAKGIDTAPQGGAVLSVQGDANRSDPVDLQRDKSVNQLDQRHTFNGSIVIQSTVTQFGKIMNTILSDNQFGFVVQLGSGLPLTITGNRDLNLDGVNNDRPLFVERNSLYMSPRYNVDMRYSRVFRLGATRRLDVQAEFKNLFNNDQLAGVTTQIPVDTAGYPVVSATDQTRLPLSAISYDIGTYLTNRTGYEQRKFQLGFKFYF